MKPRTTTKPRQAFVNISMPAPLRDRLTKKIEQTGSYGSTSDYVRDLIRRDLDRDEQLAHLDELITEGVKSGAPIPVTEQWWKERYAALTRHRRESAKKPQRKRA